MRSIITDSVDCELELYIIYLYYLLMLKAVRV